MSVATETSHFIVIDTECNAAGGYKFNIDKLLRIGHLEGLSLTDSNTTLTPDTPVCDPTKPDNQVKIIGPIDHIRWDGGQTDPIYLTFRVSPGNRGAILEALSAAGGGASVSVKLKVFEYDHKAKVYFSRIDTDSKEVTGKIAQDTKVEIAPDPDKVIEQPVNFMVSIVISPKSDSGDQSLNVASSQEKKFVRQFGIHVS